MKHFLYKITLYILFIGLPVCIVEFFYRQIPNDFSVKKEYLENHASEIEILNLGSSLELQAINPSFFHQKAFNAALSAQPLEYDYFILEKYWNCFDSIKVIILPLSYFTLNYRQHQSRLWMYEYYNKFGFTPYYIKLVNKFAITSYHPNTIITSLFRFLTNKKYSNVLVDSLGWKEETESFADLSINDQILNATVYANDNMEKCFQNNYEFNLNLLEHIISSCLKKDIHIILVSAPKTQRYIDYIDRNKIEDIITVGNFLSTKYPNVTYINSFYDTLFEDKDFSNANHLNNSGAKKMTLILDSIIENQILIQQ